MIEKEQMIDTIPESLLRPGIDDPDRCSSQQLPLMPLPELLNCWV